MKIRFQIIAAVFCMLGLSISPLWADGIPVITPNDTGTLSYADWVDSAEKPITRTDTNGVVQKMNYLWGGRAIVDGRPLVFGESKTPGVRYLRIGMEKPVTIGSILTHGGGQLSVLKPNAELPGDLTDDSKWIPAQRIKNGKLSDDEVGTNEEVLWTFPEPVKTQAIRFTHTAAATDKNYSGGLSAIAIFPDRWANLALVAHASASASDQYSSRLIDENIKSGTGEWENISSKDGDRSQTIAEKPEWIMLDWPKPVALGGLAFAGGEFGSAEIQTYIGKEGKHPRDASESDWKTIQQFTSTKPPFSLANFQMVSFDSPITSRAVRIVLTSTVDETGIEARLRGHSRDGKRVGLGELIALESVHSAPLASVIPAIDQSAQGHPPIPIKFSIPEDGEVTLVIEDSSGKRVRNLVSQTPFTKGENTIWWDGTDDLRRDLAASDHGIYFIPPEFVTPGSYSVRGLWHKPLDLHYEFSVYSPGNPPWPTTDNSGGWMTNHTPASCAVLIPGDKAPGGQPLIGLGASVSEGGSAFSWVTQDGKKIGGRGWIGGVWTGAQYLASDLGSDAEPNVAAYVGSVFEGNKKYGVNGKIELRLTKLTTLIPSGDKPVLKEKIFFDPLPAPTDGSVAPKPAAYLGGIAVHNGLLAVSQTVLNKIVFVDAKEGTVVGEARVQDPRALIYDTEGRLLLLAGHTLLRYPKSASPPNLPAPEKLVTDLEDPRGITIDSNGNIYVSDQGKSHQVKCFSADGKLLKSFGKPGVPAAGPYDPLHMNHPKGTAVDTNGRLWVTEDDFLPKRVSVWNPDGTLWKAFYGSSRYGGGGILDSREKGTFLYDGMEFKLDWDKGDYTLTRIYYRPGDSDLQLAFRSASPEAPVYFNNKRYLTDAYNSGPTQGHESVFIFMDKGDGGAVVPVAGAGNANHWPLLQSDAFKGIWPAGHDPAGDQSKNLAFFIWNDLNGDGLVQPDEIKIVAEKSGGVTVGDDGSFLIARLGPDIDHLNATRFKPVRFTTAGAPVYDLTKPEILAPAQNPGGDGHDQLLTGTDGWLVMTTPPPPFSKLGVGGARNGTPSWSYPSLWPGLHPSHSAPVPSAPGMLIGSTRLLGGLVTPRGSEAAPLFFLNSNQGDVYAFTEDGLFVAQCFEDTRQGRLWEMPTAVRDMQVNDVSLHDENFFPSVAATSEGQVYLNAGGNMAIVRVDNLNTIKNIAATSLQVTADDLKKAQAFVVAREAARQAAQGSGVLAVSMLATAPKVDGNLDDWKEAQWAPIDHRGVNAYFDSHSKPYDVNGAVAIADGKLYAAWKTGDPILLKNAGDVPNALFKSGGALDLMIGSDAAAKHDRPSAVTGDERLLISSVGGKTKALLYRAVVPGTADKDKVPFNAPWHGITLDRVDDVSSQVELAADKDGNYEIAIPLSVLGLKPIAGTEIRGDIGILRGDGKQTTQRVYWANKATAIVSDVPSEAELTPSLWGTWAFAKK